MYISEFQQELGRECASFVHQACILLCHTSWYTNCSYILVLPECLTYDMLCDIISFNLLLNLQLYFLPFSLLLLILTKVKVAAGSLWCGPEEEVYETKWLESRWIYGSDGCPDWMKWKVVTQVNSWPSDNMCLICAFCHWYAIYLSFVHSTIQIH